MEVSQNNGTRFSEREVTEFETDVLDCYQQRGAGGAVDLVVQPRAYTSRHAVKVKREKARFDGSDMFCRPRKFYD